MRLRLRTLHRWLAVVFAVPLVMLCVSGALLVFRGEIDRTLNPGLFRLRETVHERSPNYQALIEEVRERYPGEEVLRLRMPRGPREAAVVVTDAERLVHANPYSGRILGERRRDRWQWASAVWLVQQFHVSFFVGDVGRYLGAVSAIGFVLSIVSGYGLWWPRRLRQLPRRLGVRFRGSWKRTLYELHTSTGFYLGPAMALIGITGAAITFWWGLEPAARSLNQRRVQGFEAPAASQGPRRTIDQLLAAARKHHPRSRITRVQVSPEPGRALRVRYRTPSSPYSEGLSFAWVDPVRGTVLKQHNPATRAASETIYLWVFPLHFGEWGRVFGPWIGTVTRLVWLGASLVPLGLIGTGLWMAFRR